MRRLLLRGGLLLGLALGGFFDGILLHQILQWHHLLSGVDAVRDIHTQLLADGLFHALMYLLGLAGLAALWRARAGLAAPFAAQALWGGAFAGFGGWHVLDAVLSHWLMGIHRVRMDAAQPLLWDLSWFVVFGVVPLVLAWRVLHGQPGPPDGSGSAGGGGGRAAATVLGLGVVLAGPLAALPGGDTDQVVVLFAPGIAPAQAFEALARADARVLWSDRSGGVWAVQMAEPRQAWRLYASGALMVGSAGASLGCVSWTRVAAPARPGV